MLNLMIPASVALACLNPVAETNLDSGLWRSVFLPVASEPHAPEAASTDGRPEAVSNVVTNIAVPDDLSPSVESITTSGMDAALRSDEGSAVAMHNASDVAQLSDWDRALVAATGVKQTSYTTNGPSVVSVVVGVVGLIVVCGAYLSGRG